MRRASGYFAKSHLKSACAAEPACGSSLPWALLKGPQGPRALSYGEGEKAWALPRDTQAHAGHDPLLLFLSLPLPLRARQPCGARVLEKAGRGLAMSATAQICIPVRASPSAASLATTRPLLPGCSIRPPRRREVFFAPCRPIPCPGPCPWPGGGKGLHEAWRDDAARVPQGTREVVAAAPRRQARPSRPVETPPTGSFDRIEAGADVAAWLQ